MRRLFSIALIAGIIGCGLNDDTTPENAQAENIKERIAFLEQKIFQDTTGKLGIEHGTEIIGLYSQYVAKNPKDSLAPEFLFKAAEVSMGIKNYKTAISYFENVYKNYSEFDKRIECLYLQAFIFDVNLNEKGRAKAIYERVIEEYPNHKLAQDAVSAIEILTMSDEDLIKMLEEKNAKVS